MYTQDGSVSDMLERQISIAANIFLGYHMLFNFVMHHQSYSRGTL